MRHVVRGDEASWVIDDEAVRRRGRSERRAITEEGSARVRVVLAVIALLLGAGLVAFVTMAVKDQTYASSPACAPVGSPDRETAVVYCSRSGHSEAGAGGRLASNDPMTKHQASQLHDNDPKWATLEASNTIARQSGSTPCQVALGWLLSQRAVTAPIMGARTLVQLRDNLVAADLVLDPDAIEMLTKASAPTPEDYPYGRFGVLQRDRYIDSSEQALREL